MFSSEEKEVLKEYSRICLALQELKTKTKVLKEAKKMYEETGPESFPVGVFDILGKVEIGKSIAIKDVGVELTSKRRKRVVPISKLEMQKRINDLLEPSEALLVYTNLTHKKFRLEKEVHTIECRLTND